MEFNQGDTIAAISTPAGEAGISVVRLSGPEAVAVARRVFRGGFPVESHTVAYGHVVDPLSRETLDEVLLTVFKAPRSYTREDLIEIGCHGGSVVAKSVLRALLRAGARAAAAGEFTARAFLNGRIDLAQSEAVLDLIRSRTGTAAAAALAQVRGGLSSAVGDIRAEVIGIAARIEAGIDFPDEVGSAPSEALSERLRAAINGVERLLETGERGRILREGLRVALAGLPNVGKSSLLNAILREERAIVTDVPGTTRDVIEESASISGIPVVLVDMAGVRDTLDTVERIGVERARAEISEAGVVVVVLDDSEGITSGDERLISDVCAGSRPVVVAVNKTDLGVGRVVDDDVRRIAGDALRIGRIVRVSARTGGGLEDLERAILAAMGGGAAAGPAGAGRVEGGPGGIVVTRLRHLDALERAKAALLESLGIVDECLPVDLASAALYDAVESLGEITGETAGEDIVDRIFSEFCVGK